MCVIEQTFRDGTYKVNSSTKSQPDSCGQTGPRLILQQLARRIFGFGMLTDLPTSALAPAFDENTPVTLTGTVKTVEWSTERAHAGIDVTDPAGTTASWALELGIPKVLVTHHGWTPTLLKHGDEVTVYGWPARDGRKHLIAKTVTLMNGQEFLACA